MTAYNLAKARPETVALFISDLHLQEAMPLTVAAFLHFLKNTAVKTRKLYLLGDIFEYWAGDDDINAAFIQTIVQALKALTDAGIELFWIGGNRDFLVGQEFAAATGASLLPDPFILSQGDQRFLISHGDQLCTDDTAYQQFRAMVRESSWQTTFLARPLAERKQIIAHMRAQSQQHQKQQTAMIMDVNPDAVQQFFHAHDARILIHGHTHRPALHHIGDTRRYVLSDWDCDHGAQRGDWLALHQDGSLQRCKLAK